MALCLALGTCVIYYVCNPRPAVHYDYTLRIAGALLQGQLGPTEPPPSWLNEFVPAGGRYYSVFPLGSVLTMIPLALLRASGIIESFPGHVIAALIAGAVTLLCFLVALRYQVTMQRRLMLTLFPAFGTWMWTNLAFAGAWQIALGFAVLGQLGALHFVLVRPQPLLAGFCFALAFGNRTEVILLAPVFIYLLCRQSVASAGLKACPTKELFSQWRVLAAFFCFPLLLGAMTLIYNHARFSSVFDFGYARIPGVLEEPWYRHGIFSLHAIPLNVNQMLFAPWKAINEYPFLVPTGFGGSIFLSSPFLVLIFRRGARDAGLKRAAWVAALALTLVLWCHGNPGGWQYSYRYAMVLLPWLFLVLLESTPSEARGFDTTLFFVSVAINAYATYLFFWTPYVQP